MRLRAPLLVEWRVFVEERNACDQGILDPTLDEDALLDRNLIETKLVASRIASSKP